MPQTLLKTFKILQSALSDQNPLQHTSLDPFLQNYMYILHEFCIFPVTEGNEILHLHFSSQLQEENAPKNP